MKLGSQRLKYLAGLMLLLAGLTIAVTPTYLARWIGLVLMIFGLGLLVFTVRREPEPEKEKKEEIAIEKELEERKTLADTLINALTLNRKLTLMLPIIGGFLIVFVLAFNLFIRGSLDIGAHDSITILLGITMILYNYIPQKLHRERDFAFLFFIFLFLILVVPITIYALFFGPPGENPNSPFIQYLLAQPTSDMLNFIGIRSSVHSVPPQEVVNGVPLTKVGIWIVYKNLGDEAMTPWSSVGIGLSCTGLYSVSIFISGFIAFIMIEYRRFDIRVASLLTLGVFTAWFANILRMTIIVAVGSHYGGDALYWTHANLGIFIFMLWVGIFWGVMFKVLMPKAKKGGEKDEQVEKVADGEDTQKPEEKPEEEAEKEELIQEVEEELEPSESKLEG